MNNTISIVEQEKRRRILVSVWAYAYEFLNDSLVADGVYDRESRLINLNVDTDNMLLDSFFKKHFTPDSGMWIHKHPEKDKLFRTYELIKRLQYENRNNHNG